MYVLVENYLRALEEGGLLTEAPFGPQTLGKYGLKAGTIDQQTFEQIQQASKGYPIPKQGQVIRQAGRLYVADPRAVELLLKTLVKLGTMPTADLELLVKATNVAALSHEVDALEGKSNQNEYRSGFNIESAPADWENERYKVYKAHSEDACIRYGKGYSFCIAKSHGGNMYHSYRKDDQTAFYYVFDRSFPSDDEEYITVVGVLPKGKCEFTHKSNDTARTSESYGYSLNNFLATKPGLGQGRAIFKPLPVSKAERGEYERYEELEWGNPEDYARLSPAEKIRYVALGHKLNLKRWVASPPEVRMNYINRGHMLSDEQAVQATPAECRRAAKLYFEHQNLRYLGHAPSWLWGQVTSEILGCYGREGHSIPPAAALKIPPALLPQALPFMEWLSPEQYASMDLAGKLTYLRSDPKGTEALVPQFSPEERVQWLQRTSHLPPVDYTPQEHVIIGRRLMGRALRDPELHKQFSSLNYEELPATLDFEVVMAETTKWYQAQKKQQLNESVRHEGVDAQGMRADGSPASRQQRITRWAQLAGVKQG